MSDLPAPVTTEQRYLSAICDRLGEQNTLLADLRDRLPTPVEQPVAEPEDAGMPRTVELIEPAQSVKKTPARKPAARKTAARTAASTRGS
jgi:hypothetical protein